MLPSWSANQAQKQNQNDYSNECIHWIILSVKRPRIIRFGGFSFVALTTEIIITHIRKKSIKKPSETQNFRRLFHQFHTASILKRQEECPAIAITENIHKIPLTASAALPIITMTAGKTAAA